MDGSGEQWTVIICDRHPAFAKGLADALESEGDAYRVVSVMTSLAELEKLASGGSADIVLLDASFGVDALQRMCRCVRQSAVILLGADEDQVDLGEVLRGGAVAYLLKQDDVDRIRDAIRVVLRGYSVVPHRALRRAFDGRGGIQQLSAKEREVLALLTAGWTNQEIAQALHYSERTVRRYLVRIYSKLCVSDRIQAALVAVQSGLVSGEDVRRPRD